MSYVEIEVLETRGSAPREAGTRMWVGAAETRGTIGGGNLSFQVHPLTDYAQRNFGVLYQVSPRDSWLGRAGTLSPAAGL